MKKKNYWFKKNSFLFLVLIALFIIACGGSSGPDLTDFCTVVFETEGGTPVPEPQVVVEGSKIIQPDEEIIRAGFTFGGWCINEECTDDWDFENDVVTEDTILYVRWEGGGGGRRGGGGGGSGSSPNNNNPGGSGSVTYTVTFDSNGGTPAAPQTKSVSSGSSVGSSLSGFKPTSPAAETFFGWNSKSDGTGTSFYSYTTVTSDITVFAQWNMHQGTGNPGDPYIVPTGDALQLVGRDTVTYPDWTRFKHYKQADDIDMAGETFTAIKPTSGNLDAFIGSYDGGGYKISNLEINYTGTPSGRYTGLFGYVGSGAVIKNLKLENANIQGVDHVGGIAGYIDNATIENCFVSGTIKGSTNYVGGIAGDLTGDLGIIRDCIVEVTLVEGSSRVGGVAGNIGSEAKVYDCYVIGNIKGASYVGGIVGTNYSSSLSTICEVYNCYAAGTVTATTNRSGGVVGLAQNSKTLNCVALNMEVLSPGADVARVVGQINGTNVTLTNNYARSNMKINGSALPAGTGLSSDINGEEITSADWSSLAWWQGKSFTAPFWSGKLPLPAVLP